MFSFSEVVKNCLDLMKVEQSQFVTQKLSWGFLVLTFTGMMISFSLHSFARGQLITQYKFTNPYFLTFLQLLSFCFSGIDIGYCVVSRKLDSNKCGASLFLSILIMVSSLLGNISCLRLSESTQILFRSVRLVPLMISNIYIFQKSHSVLVVLGICCIVCALVAFSIDQFSGGTRFDMHGIASTMLVMCFDSLAYNLAEKLVMTEGTKLYSTISDIYGTSFILIFAVTIVQGEILSGMKSVINNLASLGMIALYTISGHIGIIILYTVIKKYGCIAGNTLQSIGRPVITYIKAPKFTHITLFSVITMSFGIMLNIISVSLSKIPDYYDTSNHISIAQEFPLIAGDDENEEAVTA